MERKKLIYAGEIMNGYYIYEDGRLYSEKTNKFIKTRMHTGGYIMTTIWNPKQKEIYLHRAVAFSFVENPFNKKYVNHIDGNKENNHYTNLEFVTAKENIRHAVKTGLANGCVRKLNYQMAQDIRKKYQSMTQPALAKEYKVSTRTINFIISGQHWKTDHK